MALFYRLFKNKWITPLKTTEEDYTNRTVIITGVTAGIGKEAAYKFAALGAKKVILAARDLKKGEATKAELEARLGRKDQLEVWELDMMRLDSVITFAKRANELDHVDTVVLNAGIRRTQYYQSAHGWEEDLQVNTLSTTLLAILLLPKLRELKRRTNNRAVLVIVNSGLHQSAVIPENIRQKENILQHYNKPENFGEGTHYKFSKLFLMYATRKLADYTSPHDVIVTSVCPGMVMTDLGRDHYFPGVHILAFPFTTLFFQTPAQGANIILSGATAGDTVHGRFWKLDMVQPIPPSLEGPEMEELESRIWTEILEALKKNAPQVADALQPYMSLSTGHV